ncbi:hybrid sensor histidine kinase/response regulator [Stutzerimonas frequens]|uniref:hybrid sensor histidine kinase/response regulator n=1 Tax=Stutzerimonas frequens TaxID=2968969 RepID=UPI00190D698C|nr:ATP-binding protein [Stutzerimonas frequens]MBK3874632.1 response regulator [Stutzerimonas frequens]MBK3912901.1 response regulator [Stutzerimonas frequens]MBK3932147.1 response regulator [Stutzerimonas frequens]
MSIRSRLVWLVIAVIAPALAFALYGTYAVYRAQSAHVDQGMKEVSRAVALAVDRELNRYATIVTTLAASPTIVRGDLRTFHQRLQQTEHLAGTRVTILDQQGTPLADTDYAFGTPLPSLPDFRKYRPAMRIDVSPSFRDPVSGVQSIAIRRPVMRDGKVVYYLAMDFPVAGISALLDEQALPANWLGVILDQDHTVIARTRDPDKHVGRRASPDFVNQLNATAGVDGKVQSITRDAVPVTTFFSHAPDSGWLALVAIPRNDLLAAVLAPLGTVILGILVVLALAIVLAIAVGRTITRPLAQLDDAASALARGEVFDPPNTGMNETDRTAQVMAQASVTIHHSSQEMARRVKDAVAQAERSHQALLQGQKLEALGNLTAGISHEFNNLLQSMTMGLQLAEMLTSHPRAKRAIEGCQRSANRATRLTRHLMTFSRSRTADAEQVDLRLLILGMHELLTGALPNRVTLTLELPEGAWPAVLDPVQCELAILNLAINARDAMPEGGPLVIALHKLTLVQDNPFGLAPGPYLCVDVEDSGCGMSPDVQAHVFEPFFTTKPVGEGTGLGLAQVYGFARQSGGTVSLQSEGGKGTRVSLLLPRREHDAAAALEDQQVSVHAGRPARVLVVDDDAEVREAMVAMLDELGYQVDEAPSADEALARLADRRQPTIDILLSDVVMPGRLDGVGLAEEVQRLYPTIPIVLATGYTTRLAAASAFRVLAKPFSHQALAETLAEILDSNTPEP